MDIKVVCTRLTMNEETVMSDNKVGFRCISLLFSLLLIALVACEQSNPSTKTPGSGSAPVIRWIQQHALPLRTFTPGGSDADLAPLMSLTRFWRGLERGS